MNEIKRAWLSYFISIRDSRRNDMRHYTSICVAGALTIVLFISTNFIIRNSSFSRNEISILSVVTFFLGVFLVYFFREYKTAEREIKDYSDAIELVLMHVPMKNKEYQELFNLLRLQRYEKQTEWGIYLSKVNYLTSAFKEREKANYVFFQKYAQKVPSLYNCYVNSPQIMRSITSKNEIREINQFNAMDSGTPS